MTKNFEELQSALERAIGNVLSEFEDEFNPSPTSIIREEHQKVCTGITKTGNTARFCSCFTPQAIAAVIDLHSQWHRDMIERVRKLETDDGEIDLGDVEFLLSENGKWN
jgi:hypothetical protein